MNYKKVEFTKLTNTAYSPWRATPQSAGLDLFSPINTIVKAKGQTLIDLELQIQLPKGYYGQLLSKSGIAWLHSVHVGAGVIDQDFTGKIEVLLFNLGDTDFFVQRGRAIAQLVVLPCIQEEPIETEKPASGPRDKGFGTLTELKSLK